MFLLGSILQFPHIEAFGQGGMFLYLVGSILYLIITGYQCYESVNQFKVSSKQKIWTKIRIIESLLYFIGTLLFLVGSIQFLDPIDEVVSGAVFFVIGSVCFTIAAMVNIMEIIQEDGPITLQLANGIAVSFVLGSVLFMVGSIPFIWRGKDLSGNMELYQYVIWEYIVGSCLFLLGGVLALIKTYVINKQNNDTED